MSVHRVPNADRQPSCRWFQHSSLAADSSLTARKELAKEWHYSGSGDMNDSASMNIWLHKQVMQKLAENGGKVPEDLKS